MRIVFMGTPDFAVEPLKALYNKGHEVVCVITGEDKPRGRGHEITYTPVKIEALNLGLHVYQPKSMKTGEAYDYLKSLDADLYVVVAYGKILPKNILDLPKHGCINIHASLLPEYRGAAPIQWAIIDGKEYTGITTMLMDVGLDTGDILKQYKVKIEPKETGGSLFDKLAKLGGEAITDTIDLLLSGDITPVKQGDTTTEYASMLTKDMGNIDYSKSDIEIERLSRGLSPWPGTYTYMAEKMLKIKELAISDFHSDKKDTPGTIVDIKADRITVAVGKGYIDLLRVQPEGKKEMDAASWVRGSRVQVGDVFIRR